MIAIIMAGGAGTRLGLGVEKPLIKVGGMTMLERAVNALKEAHMDVLVAVSQHTPETARNARELGLTVVESPGKGYIEDMLFLFKKLALENALVVSADLPFISPELINGVLKKYDDVRRPVCAAVTEEDYRSMGFAPSAVLKHKDRMLVPVGINVVEKKEEQDYFYIISGKEAVNINTREELERIKDLH